MMGRLIVAFPALLGVPMLSVCLLGCVTPQGVALSALARELSTPERGEQRFDLQGRAYQQYAEDRYDCLLRHDLALRSMHGARGYRWIKS